MKIRLILSTFFSLWLWLRLKTVFRSTKTWMKTQYFDCFVLYRHFFIVHQYFPSKNLVVGKRRRKCEWIASLCLNYWMCLLHALQGKECEYCGKSKCCETYQPSSFANDVYMYRHWNGEAKKMTNSQWIDKASLIETYVCYNYTIC